MRLSHVTLLVSDMARARDFYQRFGLKLLVDTPHYCRFLARPDEDGGTETLSLQIHDGPITPAGHIGFEFDSPEALDAFVEQLKAKGFAVEGPQDRRWLWRDAILHDPDGHELLLLYAGENKLNPPWRV